MLFLFVWGVANLSTFCFQHADVYCMFSCMNPIPARWSKILIYISRYNSSYIINADQYTSYSNKVFKHFLSQQINYKVFLKHEICFQLRRVKGKSYINRKGLQCYICLENEFHLINKQNSTTFVLALNDFLGLMKGADINGNNFTI